MKYFIPHLLNIQTTLHKEFSQIDWWKNPKNKISFFYPSFWKTKKKHDFLCLKFEEGRMKKNKNFVWKEMKKNLLLNLTSIKKLLTYDRRKMFLMRKFLFCFNPRNIVWVGIYLSCSFGMENWGWGSKNVEIIEDRKKRGWGIFINKILDFYVVLWRILVDLGTILKAFERLTYKTSFRLAIKSNHVLKVSKLPQMQWNCKHIQNNIIIFISFDFWIQIWQLTKSDASVFISKPH